MNTFFRVFWEQAGKRGYVACTADYPTLERAERAAASLRDGLSFRNVEIAFVQFAA